MLALCTSKSNAGRWARNYIPFQESLLTIWKKTLHKLGSLQDSGHWNKLVQSLSLKGLHTIYIGDYSRADDVKFPEVSSVFIIFDNAIWQEPSCIIYGGWPVLNSHNICPPLPNPLQLSSQSQGYLLIIGTILFSEWREVLDRELIWRCMRHFFPCTNENKSLETWKENSFIWMQRRHHTLLCALSICNFLFCSRTFILRTIFCSMHMIYGLMNTFIHACFFT
jgi:hypothetical protein